MHKILFLGTVITLFFTINLSAEMKFGIAGFGSWSYIVNKDFNDAISGNAQQKADNSNIATSADQITGTWSGEFELRLILSEKFIIALNPGYIYLPKADITQNNNPIERYSFYSIPLSLAGYYVFQISDKLTIDLGLAPGVYLGHLTVTSLNTSPNQAYEFHANGFGAELRIFSEYKLSQQIAIIGGIAGRYAKISGFSSTVNGVKETLKSLDQQANGKTYHLWENLTDAEIQQDQNDPTIKNLKDAELDLSGVNIYLGIGFNF